MHKHCPHSCSSSCHGQRHGDRQYLRWPYPEWAALGFIRKDPKRRSVSSLITISVRPEENSSAPLCLSLFFIKTTTKVLFSFSKETFKIRALKIRGQPWSSLFTDHCALKATTLSMIMLFMLFAVWQAASMSALLPWNWSTLLLHYVVFWHHPEVNLARYNFWFRVWKKENMSNYPFFPRLRNT